MNWYLEALKKYAYFSGRSCRKEYWMFIFINFLIGMTLTFIDVKTGTFNQESGIGLLGNIYALAVLIPYIAVTFRRLHDTGRSAWWLLIIFIPLIGVIVLLAFMLQNSQEEKNNYGVSPKLSA